MHDCIHEQGLIETTGMQMYVCVYVCVCARSRVMLNIRMYASIFAISILC